MKNEERKMKNVMGEILVFHLSFFIFYAEIELA